MNLRDFEITKNETIEINIRYRYTKRHFEKERKYYQKFYKNFTDYMYAKGCIDNYVGSLIKTLRSFFIYLNINEIDRYCIKKTQFLELLSSF